MDVLAAIPVKPFSTAKARLSSIVDAAGRSRLGEDFAARTAAVAREAGAVATIVTSDDTVAAWSASVGLQVIPEGPDHGTGLDGAARAAVAHAAVHGTAWAIIHADLPIVTPDDLVAVFDTARSGVALAPSYNGGTNVIAGSTRTFPFSYGPGSFHRHLAGVPDSVVINRPGLALDLDAPQDLDRAARLGMRRWDTS